MRKVRIWHLVCAPLVLLCGGLFGGLLGLGLAITANTKNTENFTEFDMALPTKLLDINGEVITEFSGEEKREIISFNQLPQTIVDALLSREDRIFYEHPGFSMKAILRAVIGQLTGHEAGGGSTLTQQIAGTLYCDRNDKSVKRKLKELWWAIQMERRYSKDEILELYLNKTYFGGGTNGVSAACKYYFGHDATQITPAEAALLVIQLSAPTRYNPFEHPDVAMDRQQFVLDAMVQEGYLTQEEADESFDDYWAHFDLTRTSTSAYALRTDKAPWFSEYVRRELSSQLYGTDDIYTSGFTINTTLNLSHQQAAEEIMQDYIAYANRTYKDSLNDSRRSYFRSYVPLSELVCLVFNLPNMKVSAQRAEVLSMNEYTTTMNPIVDIMAMLGGMDTLKTEIANRGNNLLKQNAERTTIEGTMIALENGTGYIDALVGGSKYDASNQFIRAVQAKLQPGSTFKPLYYSAAIDSREFTMTTVISDTPIVFHKDDGTPYIPQNFRGEFEGQVELWYALAHSMNIPSLKVLDGIGFDAAITRASTLLGIPQDELAARSFEPVYPLGLGVCSVRPVELAKAFATFANNGREVTPIAIRNVEDRNGNIVMNQERDLLDVQKAKGGKEQVISEQTAFIMQEMLKRTVQSGTLQYGSSFDSTRATVRKNKGAGSKFRFQTENGRSFFMPAAGKTGTTQNWADAWTVGFTPYYTAAFWFGFDRPGQSLGLKITGSTLAGVAWGDFMNVANRGKPYKPFFDSVPEGVVQLTVCSESGQLLTPECGNHQVTAYYLAGTEPTETCTVHRNNVGRILGEQRIEAEFYRSGVSYDAFDDGEITLNLDFLNTSTPTGGTTDISDVFADLFGTEPEEAGGDADDDGDGANWFLQ